MKQLSLLNLVASALVLCGCGQKIQTTKATAEQLQKSFEKTEPAVAQEVREASSALQASNYTQAVVIMNRVVQSQTIDQNQKQAVDALIIQTREAIQRDPKLDSPQLYQALSDLLTRVHGEN
jgi:hypothetical protein